MVLLFAPGAAGTLQSPHLHLQPRCGGVGEGRQRGGTPHSGSPALPGGPGPFLAWPSSAPSPSPSPDGSSPAQLQTRPPAPTWDTASGQLLGCPYRAPARAAAPHPTTIFCLWYSSIFSSASLSCRSCSSLYLWFSSLMRLISAWIFFCCSCLRSKSCKRGRGAEGWWDQSLPSGGGGLHGLGLFLRMFQPPQETRALILPPVVSPPRVSTPFQRGEGSPSSPPCPPSCFLPADLLVLQLQLLQVLQHLPRLLVPLLSSQCPLLRVLLYLLHQLLPPSARRSPPPAQPQALER